MTRCKNEATFELEYMHLGHYENHLVCDKHVAYYLRKVLRVDGHSENISIVDLLSD